MHTTKCILILLLIGWVLSFSALLVPSNTLAGAVDPKVSSACGDEEGCLQGNIDRIGPGEIVINDGLYRIDPAAAIDLDRFAVGQIVAYRADHKRFIVYLQLLSQGGASKTRAAEDALPPQPRRSGKDPAPRQEQGVWRN